MARDTAAKGGSKPESGDKVGFSLTKVGGHLEMNASAFEELDWLSLEKDIEAMLCESSLLGHGVVSAQVSLGSQEDATRVPHFGHSIGCDAPDCEHRRDTEEVFRIFDVSLLVSGDPSNEIFGAYRLNKAIRFVAASLDKFQQPGERERPRVAGIRSE